MDKWMDRWNPEHYYEQMDAIPSNAIFLTYKWMDGWNPEHCCTNGQIDEQMDAIPSNTH
ncbi:13946_t:CDS:2 [Rhizophagus irregularis]|nr:13946_t:CDS:2 [Rhizophagus irregularis]